MSDSVTNTLSFQLQHTFAAPQKRVFQAWTEPDVFQRWFRPSGGQTVSAEMDVRVGGTFRLSMQPAQGETFFITGKYLEVAPHERLVMTWVAPPSGDVETVVSLDFRDQDEVTEVLLTHEGIPSKESMLGFMNGWRPAFDELDIELSQ